MQTINTKAEAETFYAATGDVDELAGWGWYVCEDCQTVFDVATESDEPPTQCFACWLESMPTP